MIGFFVVDYITLMRPLRQPKRSSSNADRSMSLKRTSRLKNSNFLVELSLVYQTKCQAEKRGTPLTASMSIFETSLSASDGWGAIGIWTNGNSTTPGSWSHLHISSGFKSTELATVLHWFMYLTLHAFLTRLKSRFFFKRKLWVGKHKTYQPGHGTSTQPRSGTSIFILSSTFQSAGNFFEILADPLNVTLPGICISFW